MSFVVVYIAHHLPDSKPTSRSSHNETIDIFANALNPTLSCCAGFVPLNIKEGSSVSLECELTRVKDGNSVKWLKDGSEVAYESFTSASAHRASYSVDSEDYKLTIAEVSLDDDGIYDCAMFNERKEFVIKSKWRYKLAVQGW